jgi:hypothetical protein
VIAKGNVKGRKPFPPDRVFNARMAVLIAPPSMRESNESIRAGICLPADKLARGLQAAITLRGLREQDRAERAANDNQTQDKSSGNRDFVDCWEETEQRRRPDGRTRSAMPIAQSIAHGKPRRMPGGGNVSDGLYLGRNVTRARQVSG